MKIYFIQPLFFIGLLLLISFNCLSSTPLERQKSRPRGTTTLKYGFYEYVPSNYSSVAKHPVVIFLHGIGEKGDGSTNLVRLAKHGPFKLVKEGWDLPYIAFAAQHPSGWWNGNDLRTVIQYVKANYKVDLARIYVTGLSSGGYGTWTAGATCSDLVAAIVPVSGCGSTSQASQLKSVKVWAFHNQGDKSVLSSCHVNMVKAVNAAGGSAKITLYPVNGHDAYTKTYYDKNMWSWLLNQRKGTTGNSAPYVNAGSDKTITLPATSMSFTSSASDSDGKISSYAWTKVSGPGCTLSNTNSATLSVSSLIAGTYVFRITVKDNLNASSYDEVKLVVNAVKSPSNIPPTVNAGIDKTLTLPTSSATLTAAAEDKDGKVTYTLWTKISGPSATMTNASQKSLQLSRLVAGTYIFKITVKDDLKAAASDEIKLTVKPSATYTVNAGSDKSITLPANSIALTATTSDKSVYYTLWTKVSGPSATMKNSSQKTMQLSNLVAGTYVFRMTMKNNAKVAVSDEVKVTVKAVSARLAAPTTSESQISLFPNPATDRFSLKINSQEEVLTHVAIVNSKGVTIHESDQILSTAVSPDISLSQFPSDIYFVRITYGNKSNILRLIKH